MRRLACVDYDEGNLSKSLVGNIEVILNELAHVGIFQTPEACGDIFCSPLRRLDKSLMRHLWISVAG
jgi:hypothetical protein